jgi:predicted  nucleic acid-binding Zn-ribbon protein
MNYSCDKEGPARHSPKGILNRRAMTAPSECSLLTLRPHHKRSRVDWRATSTPDCSTRAFVQTMRSPRRRSERGSMSVRQYWPPVEAPAHCSKCGTLRGDANEAPRAPCSECGCTTMSFHVCAKDHVSVTDNVSAVSRTTNASMARVMQLDAAVADIGTAVDGGSVHAAQAALKHALEAIHELTDCLERSEWSQQGWSADDLGLWRAHIGARNAAHHKSWSAVALHTDGSRDDRLRWDLNPSDMNQLQSRSQAAEFSSRLAGQPVLPALRRLAVLVSSAVG